MKINKINLISLLFISILLVFPTNGVANFPDNGTYISVDAGAAKSYDNMLDSSKLIIVEAFATWCTPCKEEQYELSKVKQAFGNNVTIFSLSVSPSTDNIDKIIKFRNEAESSYDFDASWEFGLDKDLVFRNLNNIEILPTTFLFNQDGETIKRWETIVNASIIGSYINANVTIPEDDPANQLITSLTSNLLFRLTLIGIILGVVYKILVPSTKLED